MCKELEAAGQKNPEYYTNAFMLQTVIYNNTNQTNEKEDPAIYEKNPTLQGKKPELDIKKLDIENLKAAIAEQKYFTRTKENLLKVYDLVETNQVFGAPQVKEILGCTTTASKDIMKKLRDMCVVTEVKGRGKGKYRFVYESDIDK